jgi:hypothetical protein
MKTLLLLFLFAVSIAAKPDESPRNAIIIGDNGPPTSNLATTQRALVAVMNRPMTIPYPVWTIHLERDRDSSPIVKNAEAKKEYHERFIKWVRSNIAEKDKGKDESPPMLTITLREYLALYGLAAAARERAMANWSRSIFSPHNHIIAHVTSVYEAIDAKGDEASASEKAFEKSAREMLWAFHEARQGKASDGQRATIKAFAESLAK